MGGAVFLRFRACSVLDAQGVMGGVLILRFVRFLELPGIGPWPGTIVPVPYPLPVES